MNIYQKLQKTRIDLQNMKLQKSGKNAYSNFTYYELSDFLPAINSLCNKNGLYTQFSIVSEEGLEKAVLIIVNNELPEERVMFTSPTAEAEIGKKKDGTGGADPIQNLGGKITYLRRYLLQMAFEMVEPEMVDSINRELTVEVSDEDKEKINAAKSIADLTKVCGELKTKYKISLITPLYEEAKIKLEQKESKA